MQSGIFLFVFLINNLYKRQTFRSRYGHTTVIAKSILISTGLSLPIVLIFEWTLFSGYARHVLLYFVPISLVSASILRLNIVKYLVHRPGRNGGRRKLLIVGGDSAANNVAEAIQRDPHPAFVIVGFIDDYKAKGAPILDEWENLGKLDDLNSILESRRPDEILIAIDNAPYSRLVHVVETCLTTGYIVRVFSDRLGVLASRLGAELYAEDIPVIMLSQVQPTMFSRAVRRFFDVTVSLFVLILLSPLLLAVIVGIKLSSPGPIIFRQTRIGYNGRPFDFYKFRSMHVGKAEGQHKEFVEKFIKGVPEADANGMQMQVFKITDDPRIFPFGKFIRRTSLDEFPQLINVLKGDMGLVGPRPCLPYEWDAYDDWHKTRLKVLPGCTGLWQVLGRSVVTFEDMVIMDLYYISNYSLIEDIRILYRTIPAIFFAKGGF